MVTFHTDWFFVAVCSTGAVGLTGVVFALLKRRPGPWFMWARGFAIGAMIVQVAVGVILYQQGHRPASGFHVFYGVVIAFTLTFAYVYRAQLARRPELAYGLLLLFVMGLGLRAWSYAG